MLVILIKAVSFSNVILEAGQTVYLDLKTNIAYSNAAGHFDLFPSEWTVLN